MNIFAMKLWKWVMKMKDKFNEIKELRVELNILMTRMNKLHELKYKNTLEFLKQGDVMCSLVDIQENVMKSYRDILIARIMVLEKEMR